MEEQEIKFGDRRHFSLWRIDGGVGVAKYEWGLGVSVRLYGLDSATKSWAGNQIRFQFGPLWLDLELRP